MKRLETSIGDKFGRWTVISEIKVIPDNKGNLKTSVSVKCECGNEKTHFLYVLKKGVSKSCGCLRKEEQSQRGKLTYTHNLSKHPLYGIWRGIKQRCRLTTDKYFYNYGGRGVDMCDIWYDNFKIFYDWAIDNGWEKGLEINRKDNNGHYEPSNCNFVTSATNMRNTRRTHFLEFNGIRKCITDWATDIGITPTRLHRRVQSWGIEKALTTPKLYTN